MFTAKQTPRAARRLIALVSILGAMLIPSVGSAAPPTAAPAGIHDARFAPPIDTERARIWTVQDGTTATANHWNNYYKKEQARKKAAEKKAAKKRAEKKAAEKKAAQKYAEKKAANKYAAKKYAQKKAAYKYAQKKAALKRR